VEKKNIFKDRITKKIYKNFKWINLLIDFITYINE
jgi:hypothetical protein